MLTILEIKQKSFGKEKIAIKQNPIWDFLNVLNMIYSHSKEFFLSSKFVSYEFNYCIKNVIPMSKTHCLSHRFLLLGQV